MQPSAAAIQPSCTDGQGNCLFSVHKEEKQEENEGKVEEEDNKQEEEGQDQNNNAVFCSSAAELYSWRRQLFSSFQ